ncbi:3-hydroxyisobutyryl-CoA hydrolase, mitochondrial [Diabrotica virgifera virgifera]|uniref:3-hydroxyisobutyryl-CoA hydrolase, mitochondrial n=1 Tax=Diabrotica virgifera virgifera TaxID=50390 RepID=A0ABM5I912_DIAVI|nr:3-hydroxyisobutyryl-CoA hydrolase, mitochondrial [Diabrotica virgifera virgifera]
MSISSPSCLFIRLSRRNTLITSRKCSTQSVLTKEVGKNALVILNRPKVLNSLNVNLQKNVYKTLMDLQNKKSLIVIKGAGDRAFSSGGDLVLLKEAGLKQDWVYTNEMIIYHNAIIHLVRNYKILIVALMNGITMGGGAGYSVNSRFRVATEKTKFAMPEVKVGFLPNASATYFFHRTIGHLGYYLALTGNTITGSDVLRAGFATHYCNHSDLPLLEEELLRCSSDGSINAVLDTFCQKDIPELTLQPVMDKIKKCFSEPTVESIFAKLRDDGSPWARDTLNLMEKYSPSSLKVILKQLQKGKCMSWLECLNMEYNLTVNFYKFKDLYEGTRVVLQDKNDTPKWDPPNLAGVTEELVEKHFEQISQEEFNKLMKDIEKS